MGEPLMAGDWIKVRGQLLQHPKLIALSRILQKDRAFRDWLTPGGGSPMNGQIVSDEALRCVTCALLVRVWSASREFGKNVGEDLILQHVTITDLDLMAGCPGFGEAMEAVGWAKEEEERQGVILPNFKQHNVPMTPAEKQVEYRKRQKDQPVRVTKTLPARYSNVTTREEKRREEKNSPTESNPLPLAENPGLFDPILDRAFDESPDRLVEESAFVTRWNQLEAAAGRGLRGLSADRSRSFWLIRGDPELWAKCQEAMAKMRSGLQNGAKISLQKFLTEETILEIIGGKHDFTPGKSRGSVGLNAVSAAQSQSGGSEEEIGGPQVDL